MTGLLDNPDGANMILYRTFVMEIFKIMHRLTDLIPKDFFTFSTSGLSGNGYKLLKLRVRMDVGKFWFSFRVVDLWNSLPDEVVDAGTVNSFE